MAVSKCHNEQWGLCNFPACPGDCPGRGNEYAIQTPDDFKFESDEPGGIPVAVPYNDALGSMPYIEPYEPTEPYEPYDTMGGAFADMAIPSRKYEPYNAMQEAIKDLNMVGYSTISVTISKVGVGKSIFKKDDF